ncbi:sigma-54-dependent Fis family transcriptional regulator [Achromobacter aloeverae]|uniref:Sigma-54-dependent Fis family transcriptional regulator n=1 Tax=Achromobacter aloeverae TaxID=1750518 RepID=A0A4Q1HQX7_9BURK|nr:sigma-54-dependent Fis family transcriptional regulator [Achromobacter aloeverae]
MAIHEEIDLYVWEGTSDIAARAERCLSGYDVSVIRADAGLAFPPPREAARPAVALVSVTVMNDARFSGHDWLATQGIPVIWVASEERNRDPRYYPPAYSYTLPLSFTGAALRALLFRLAGIAHAADRAAARAPRPLVAVSEAMRALLAEAQTFADCRASVLIHGETGVGKERVARLLHDHASWSAGPFVAVNCGAIPEGLFEAHFFGHAKGAFTGAIGAHKGYFEQANGGTLFLDEIGDLPLYQQVKLLRVLEQNTVTRLGSTSEVNVDFRLVAATNKNLRALVAEGAFRADLYYRLAVVELHVPNLEARGPAEKAAIFKALLERYLPGDTVTVPEWLIARVSRTRFPGNVRELSNLVERVGIIRRQFRDWDQERIERVFDRMGQGAAPGPGVALPAAREGEPAARAPFTPAEQAERARVVAALAANGWRRQDTANMLGISRKVLWEKMRKFQLAEGQGELADGAVETP